ISQNLLGQEITTVTNLCRMSSWRSKKMTLEKVKADDISRCETRM
ncbi:473_t:CDS:2, partial [Racocetra fulgida]